MYLHIILWKINVTFFHIKDGNGKKVMSKNNIRFEEL